MTDLWIRDLDLRHGTAEEVADAVATQADDVLGPDTVVLPESQTVVLLEATVVGDRVPADHRVVEVMRRADQVLDEHVGTGGITRLVTVGGIALVDAGAVVRDGDVLFPPADPDAVAAELADRLGAPVVLVSRATPTRRPTALAQAGGAPSSDGADSLAGITDLLVADRTGVVVRGVSRAGMPGDEHPTWPAPLSVREALGVAPGTAEALEVGLAEAQSDDVEERVARACRLAVRGGLPDIPDWHPVHRHVRARVDLTTVRASVVQLGVRLEADDDLTLGVAVGRLIVALAAEGLAGTPIQHETARSALVAVVSVG